MYHYTSVMKHPSCDVTVITASKTHLVTLCTQQLYSGNNTFLENHPFQQQMMIKRASMYYNTFAW